MICIFDIETIPDTELLTQMYDFSGSEIEVCNQAFVAQAQKSGSEFLPIPFHRIISISSVVCDEFGRFVKVGNFGKNAKERFLEQSSLESNILDNFESGLLKDFWEYFNNKQPSLVSFNGRAFDMVALSLRAMRYNIQAGGYFETDNPQYNKNKWENYRQRYSERFHTDLLDSLGNFGSARGLTLDSVCKMCGIVGKYDISGAQVYDIFFSTQDKRAALDKIEEYCQSDVLNTYWLYLKYAILKGELLINDYNVILEDFREKLPREKGYYEAFYTQITQELQKLKV